MAKKKAQAKQPPKKTKVATRAAAPAKKAEKKAKEASAKRVARAEFSREVDRDDAPPPAKGGARPKMSSSKGKKASRAAARLLRDLHDQFDSWDLALAAYNAGAGRVERALARNPGASFWQLAARDLLPRSTREYVPKVLATALVASRPEWFGLESVDRDEPLRYDTYVVSHRLEVGTIASLCGRPRA